MRKLPHNFLNVSKKTLNRSPSLKGKTKKLRRKISRKGQLLLFGTISITNNIRKMCMGKITFPFIIFRNIPQI